MKYIKNYLTVFVLGIVNPVYSQDVKKNRIVTLDKKKGPRRALNYL